MTKLLDGKILAQQIKENLKSEIAQLKTIYNEPPTLASLLIGDDASALSYVSTQKKSAEDVGIHYDLVHLPANVTLQVVIQRISELNTQARCHGIIVQTPTPPQIDYATIVNSIDPLKAVEGMNTANMGKFILGGPKLVPCTAAAVMDLLASTGVDLKGKDVVIIGRSVTVGKPLILLLLEKNLTVTVCHSRTPPQKLVDHIRRADVVVAAVGKPGFIQGEWIKDGAIVIDVGINKVGSKIVGDVEFDVAQKKAAYITPVPGGVGPLTAIILMRNCLEAYKFQKNNVGVTL